MSKLFESLGVGIIIVLSILYNMFSWGVVYFKFWGWFILPIFPALPVITFLEAIGLMFFIDLFKNQGMQVVKDEYLDKSLTNTFLFLGPWIILLLGWVTKLIIL